MRSLLLDVHVLSDALREREVDSTDGTFILSLYTFFLHLFS